MGGTGEAAIRRPAVALQDAVEVGAEDLDGLRVAAPRRDPVDGDALADERPQPRLGALHPPAGLIGGHHRGGAHTRDQGGVGRLERACLPGDRPDDAARRDRDPELLAEQLRDLRGGEPELLAQPGGERHGARAEHRGGRAEGIGCLQGVAALVAATAAPAVADPDVEAPTDRPQLGQLLLVLVGDPVELDLPAALAAIRKRGLEHLVDLLGGRPAGTLAVVGAGPSARPAGIRAWASRARTGRPGASPCGAAPRPCARARRCASAGARPRRADWRSRLRAGRFGLRGGRARRRPREAGAQRRVRRGGASEPTLTAVDISPAGTR